MESRVGCGVETVSALVTWRYWRYKQELRAGDAQRMQGEAGASLMRVSTIVMIPTGTTCDSYRFRELDEAEPSGFNRQRVPKAETALGPTPAHKWKIRPNLADCPAQALYHYSGACMGKLVAKNQRIASILFQS
jgi:hypothetical protein